MKSLKPLTTAKMYKFPKAVGGALILLIALSGCQSDGPLVPTTQLAESPSIDTTRYTTPSLPKLDVTISNTNVCLESVPNRDGKGAIVSWKTQRKSVDAVVSRSDAQVGEYHVATFDGKGAQTLDVNCVLPKGESGASFARSYTSSRFTRQNVMGLIGTTAALMTGPVTCVGYPGDPNFYCDLGNGDAAVCYPTYAILRHSTTSSMLRSDDRAVSLGAAATRTGNAEYNCDVYSGGGLQWDIPVQGSTSTPQTDAGWINQNNSGYGGTFNTGGYYYYPPGSNCEAGGCGGGGNGGGGVEWCDPEIRHSDMLTRAGLQAIRTCTPCPPYTVKAGTYCAVSTEIPEVDPSTLSTDVIVYSGGTFPNCSQVQSDPARNVWCTYSKLPDPAEKTAINAAITAIQGRGGYCTTIASMLKNRLDVGALRIFPGAVATFGGVVSDISAGTDGWLMIAREFVYATAGGPVVNPYGSGTISRTLQQLLAHEGDHLMGNTHTDVSLGGFKTPHSGSCSDVPAS